MSLYPSTFHSIIHNGPHVHPLQVAPIHLSGNTNTHVRADKCSTMIVSGVCRSGEVHLWDLLASFWMRLTLSGENELRYWLGSMFSPKPEAVKTLLSWRTENLLNSQIWLVRWVLIPFFSHSWYDYLHWRGNQTLRAVNPQEPFSNHDIGAISQHPAFLNSARNLTVNVLAVRWWC